MMNCNSALILPIYNWRQKVSEPKWGMCRKKIWTPPQLTTKVVFFRCCFLPLVWTAVKHRKEKKSRFRTKCLNQFYRKLYLYFFSLMSSLYVFLLPVTRICYKGRMGFLPSQLHCIQSSYQCKGIVVDQNPWKLQVCFGQEWLFFDRSK